MEGVVMHKDRLLRLAEFLETKKFNENEMFDLSFWHRESKCGTTACAIGWGVEIFKEEGLILIKDDSPYSIYYPVYKNKGSLHAVMSFFGISEFDFTYLFVDESYSEEDHDNPLAVATRIREFVKEKEAE
jgi:hypothetical protein